MEIVSKEGDRNQGNGEVDSLVRAAALDTCCSSNVAGWEWLEGYVENLRDEESKGDRTKGVV